MKITHFWAAFADVSWDIWRMQTLLANRAPANALHRDVDGPSLTSWINDHGAGK